MLDCPDSISEANSISKKSYVQRINYLIQAAALVNNFDNNLARLYITKAVKYSEKYLFRLDSSIKRHFCRGCNTFLYPNDTASISFKEEIFKVDNADKKINWIIITCNTCKRTEIMALLEKSPSSTRDLHLKFNLLGNESAASCKLTAGRLIETPNGNKIPLGDYTSVLCSIIGPYEERRKRIKPTFAVYPNRLKLTVFLRPNGGIILNRHRNYEFAIIKVLQSIITTNTLPLCGLSFIIQIFNDSGSLLAHSINSCIISCIIGGFPLECIPVAVSIGITQENSQFLVDPSESDMAKCACVVTLVCDPERDVVLSQSIDYGLCLLDKGGHKALIDLALLNAKAVREKITHACNEYGDKIRQFFIANNTNEPNLL